MDSDLLEQIERELAAATECHPLPWTWWKCGGYDRLASGIQGNDFEFPFHGSIMDDGSAGGEYGKEIEPAGVYGVFFAHAPAHIRALLDELKAREPVVQASLALEDARNALLTLDARMEPTQEWNERRSLAWDAWAKALKAHEEAVKVFKEAKNAT